ncbi:MAG: DUF4383 domain-containing protein [Gaiellaceae bacterium]
MLMGIVFLLVGVLGFIPGITTDYDQLGNFGEVGAKLLGIVGINWLENVVHLLYGVLGLALARTWDGSRAYFLGGGVIYLVLWIYGLVIDLDSNANFLSVNNASNWLHFILGVVMVGIGVLLGRDRGHVGGRDRVATEGAPRL